MEIFNHTKLFSSLKLLILSVFLFVMFTINVSATAPTITGDSTLDFSSLPGVKNYTDPSGDIGVPAVIGTSTDTGWNIVNTYVWYDVTTDKLYVGIKCTKICGDADGDGNPGTTSPALAAIPGSDTDWGPGETAGFIINTNAAVNVNFNIIVGKRTNNSGIATWGIYYFNQSSELSAGVDSNWLLPDILDPNRPAFVATSSILAFTHDLEFVINGFSTLNGVDKSNMKIGVFMGSSTDDGIGEDSLAGQGTPFSVQKLTVIKQVINDDGGTKVVSDFPLSVDNGIGSVTSNVGVSALTATPYTVSEVQQAGYTQTSLTCVDDTLHTAVTHPVTFSAGQNVTCTIVNNDIAPKLTVVKTVTNNNGGTKVVADFPLSVSPTIGTVTSGTQNTVKAAVTYTVSETAQAGYTQTSLTCKDDSNNAALVHPIALALAQNATCTIVNDDVAPKLTVIKTVINDNGGTKVAADFVLNVAPTLGVVTTGTQNTVTANVAYTVSETQLTGYSQTSLICKDDATSTTLTNPVTLAPGQNATCTIINDDIAPKLTIVKTVINDNGGTKVASDFVLNVAPTIGTVTTGVQNTVMAAVAYTASETQLPGYLQTSLTCTDDVSHTTLVHPITLALAQTATCTIVNNDIAPKLTIIKTVINDNGGTKVASDFPLSVAPTIGTVTTGVQNTVMAAVAYTASETQQAGYSQTSLICTDDVSHATLTHPVTLALAQNATCTFVNDDISPKLTIVKTVINDNGGTKVAGDFPLSVAPTIGTVTTGTQTNVLAGVAYTASETQLSGYLQTSLNCIDDISHSTLTHPITLILAQTATCTITNNDIAPKLTVIKTVINDNGGTKVISDFPLFIDNVAAISGTQYISTAVTPHTVSETLQTGYTQTSLTCKDDSTAATVTHPVVLSLAQNVTCTIVNNDIAPKLTIVKTVINDNGGNKVASDFPLTVAPTIGTVTTGVQTTVNAGVAYTASETAQTGYTQTSLTCIDDISHATLTHPVTLALAQTATCTIVNDDIAPKLKVVKVVINDNSGILTAADFNLFIDGVATTTGVQKTVTANAPHTASETLQAGYDQLSLTCVLDTGGASILHPVTLLPGQSATCTIINDDIDVTKACIGDRVYEDLNGNGIEDASDTGIPNVIVKITLLDGSTATTTTDSTGTYSFCHLPPGSYKVEVDKTQTAITTYPNFSYGFDPTTPLTYTKTLNSGDFYKDADFGFISYAKIGDQVFIDKDKNCIFDGDNKGVEGVKINLKDSTGVIQTALTDKDGFYYFVIPSNKIYTVEIDPAWKTLPALDLGTPNCGLTKDSPKLTTHQTYLDLDFGFDKAFPFDIHDPAQTQCLGIEIHFIIDIKNTSSLTAKNIKFTDQLPQGVRFVSFTSTSPSNGSSVNGNELQVKFDSMPGNSVITMNIIGISSLAGGLTNTSFASDETGLLVSHIEKADIKILDSGMPACKLPDTGANGSPLIFIALLMFGVGTIGYKMNRMEGVAS